MVWRLTRLFAFNMTKATKSIQFPWYHRDYMTTLQPNKAMGHAVLSFPSYQTQQWIDGLQASSQINHFHLHQISISPHGLLSSCNEISLETNGRRKVVEVSSNMLLHKYWNILLKLRKKKRKQWKSRIKDLQF